MKFERETCNLLRNLGVNNSYKGFRYTAYGVGRVIRNPELLTYISKGLYVEVAGRFETTVGCVERDIRTVVKAIWEHGDRQLLAKVLGCEPVHRPRNGVFIDAIAHYLEEQHTD